MTDWYYIITPQMIAAGLRGNELLAYAVIYGYSQNGQGCYFGSLAYLCEVTGMARRTAVEVLARLCARGLLRKEERVTDNVRRCYYQAVEGVVQNLHCPVQNPHGGGAESALNNIIYNSPPVDIFNKLNITTPPPAQKQGRTQTQILRDLEEAGCDTRSIQDWLLARGRHPVTESVVEAMQREAHKAGISISDAVRLCAENSWRGFRAEYLRRKGGTTVMQGLKTTAQKLFGNGND